MFENAFCFAALFAQLLRKLRLYVHHKMHRMEET